MKQIISASMREDIITNPVRYAYLQEFLKTGEYRICNKYKDEIAKVDLNNIGAICLWSKNYNNFILDKGLLTDHNLFFNFTITGYTKCVEPGVIPTEEAILQMKYLAETYGPEVINWRFDPIGLFGTRIEHPLDLSFDGIYMRFENICKQVSAFGIKRCTIGFVDYYEHVKQRLDNLGIYYYRRYRGLQEKLDIVRKLVIIANRYNVTLYSCANATLEKVEGVLHSSCIDGKLLSEVYNIKFTKSINTQRKDCGCTKSIDIGMYTKCPNGCIYCYGDA